MNAPRDFNREQAMAAIRLALDLRYVAEHPPEPPPGWVVTM